jgi:type I restriction enzyme S subunit
VGVIPDDWEVKKLGELARFRTGPFGNTLHKEDYTNNGIPIVNPMHIVHGDIVATQEMTITAQRACELADFRLREGDIVIGRRGEMGRCAVVKAVQNGWLCGTGSMIIRTNSLASADFLQLVLSSPPIVADIENASVGSTMVNLNQSVLAGLKVALPGSKEEQETISSSIKAAGAQVEALQALITKKQQIKQANMQALLTGKRRLPGFEGEWEVKRLGDVLSICHGKSQRDVEVTNGPYPILATGGQIGTAERPLYSRPSVLIGRKGTINKPQYMDTPFWTVDTLFYSEMKEVNSARFFYYLFYTIDWMQFNEASGVPSLNAKTIETIEVGCPTTQEQDAIASVLSELDAELAALEARKVKAQQLKQGMMQQLLTGKIRLA